MRSIVTAFKLRGVLAGLAAVAWVPVDLALGQGPGPDVVHAGAPATMEGLPCAGPFVYSVTDTATGRTVMRGRTSDDGSLGEGFALGSNRSYTMVYVQPRLGLIGSVLFTTGPDGTVTRVPPVRMGTDIGRDGDGDGLSDDMERTLGLDPGSVDSDGDGIGDNVIAMAPPGAPGFPVGGPPSIVNSVRVPGICVDVAAFNDMVSLACLERGVVVFNVFNGQSPLQVAAVDTPGEARAVGIPTPLLAVADGFAGLAIIDLSDPPSAFIRSQIALGSYAQAVASDGELAFVGLRNGQLVMVDLRTATVLERLRLEGPAFDVVISGDHVWAVGGNTLYSLFPGRGELELVGTAPLSSIGPDPLSGRKRLFVGGGLALPTCMSGFDSLDVANPNAMMRLGSAPARGQGSFKHIVSNGSRLGLACVGVNPRNDGTHDLDLHNLADPANTEDFLATLNTPGIAYAVSLYHGMAYVADGPEGLQVLRYLDLDRLRQAPTLRLESSFSVEGGMGNAEEGKRMRITAVATDDVQIRNVDFFVDGARRATDGNFPFEHFFTTPLRSSARTEFTVRARAFDTGGNSTWSETITFRLVPDGTPPRVRRLVPYNGALVGAVRNVSAFFSEPLNPATVDGTSVSLTNGGPDDIHGTADDTTAVGTLTYRGALNAVVVDFPDRLPPGNYQFTVRPPIADLAGNPVAAPVTSRFRVFSFVDDDMDGMPDEIEAALGLDPTKADTDGDGILDGFEDNDNDGLPNAGEIFGETDPTNPDSDGDGILDGEEDPDGDALSHAREFEAGTNPLVADTDEDGWNDEAEGAAGSNPLNPKSVPRFLVVGGPNRLAIGLPRLAFAGSGSGFTVGRPLVKIGLPAITKEQVARGVVVGAPPLRMGLTGPFNATGRGVTVARPPLQITLPQ